MKYVFLVMICLMLVGCDDSHNHHKEYADSVVRTLDKIQFEGHTYIIRDGYYKGGICHDENCKCKKNEVK